MGLRKIIFKLTGIKLKRDNKLTDLNCLDEIIKKSTKLNKLVHINTIFVGSSHCAYSVIPSLFKDNVFNFGTTSQDLYNSFSICKHYEHKGFNKIVLFYSVFTSGFNLQNTKNKDFCAYFKYAIGYDFQSPSKDLNKKVKLCRKVASELAKINKENDNGFLFPDTFFVNEDAREVADKHYRENSRNDSQLHNLISLIKYFKEKNKDIIIVIPPATSGYKNHLPEHSILFNSLFDIANINKIKVVDLYKSTDFCDADFGDASHVNMAGAIKLSNLLNKLI